MLFLLVLGLIIYWLYWHLIEKRKRLPNGPTPIPLLGNVLSIDPGNPITVFQKWSKDYGPVYTMWLGNQANVIISDYKLIKQHLTGKDAEAFAGRPRDNRLFTEMYRGRFGVILIDGNEWKEQRRFSLQVLRDFGFGKNLMEEKIMDQANELSDHIQSLMNEKDNSFTGSLSVPIQVCVANIINLIVFGRKFHYKNDTEFIRLKTLIKGNFELVARPETLLIQQSFWLRFFPYFRSTYKQIMYNNRELSKWMEGNVQDIKAQMNFDQDATSYTEAYLKEIAKRENSGENVGSFCDWQLAMIAGDLWAAGMETTLTTVQWALLYLIRKPQVQDRIYKELVEQIGASTEGDIKMSDRPKLPYTSAAIMEVQRLANIIPINLQHRTLRDVEVGGKWIPTDTVVIPQVGQVHLDSEIFGDPHDFNPDRFLSHQDGSLLKGEEVMTNNKQRKVVLPFGVGKRSCLGESLARMELFLILSTLIHRFKFQTVPGQPMPTVIPVPGVTMSPKPYNMLVTLR